MKANNLIKHDVDVSGKDERILRTNILCNRMFSVQFSSVQFSSVQFSSVQFSSVQFSSVQFSSVQFSSVQFSSSFIFKFHYIQNKYSAKETKN